jgi:hypothetical protein
MGVTGGNGRGSDSTPARTNRTHRTRPHHPSPGKSTTRSHIPTHPPHRPTTPPQTESRQLDDWTIRHAITQCTSKLTRGVRMPATDMRALPHTPRTGSYTPRSELRPLPRGIRRTEKLGKRCCHDAENRVTGTLTWPTACRSCNHLRNQTSQDRL